MDLEVMLGPRVDERIGRVEFPTSRDPYEC